MGDDTLIKLAAASLSEALFHKPTHFHLELIQNADDNEDKGNDPELRISFANNRLRFDCNEVGFSPENVEAICGIGRGHKAGVGNTTRYIDGKGIGFKSVFKVA